MASFSASSWNAHDAAFLISLIFAAALCVYLVPGYPCHGFQ